MSRDPISTDDLRAALEQIRRGKIQIDSPLIDSPAVRARVRADRRVDSVANRQVCLGLLLCDIVREQLDRERARSNPSPNPEARSMGTTLLERDFQADNTTREAWSCLHYRYTNTATRKVKLIAEIVAPQQQHATRLISRRIKYGLTLLARKLYELESEVQVELPHRGSASSPDHRMGRVDNNLPSPRDSFVGRRQILHLLAEQVTSTRLTSLIGAGGIGKTRTAIAFGLRLARQGHSMFPDGIRLIRLESATDETSVLDVFLDALSVTPSADQDRQASLLDHIRNRQLLLIVDNCEHVLETCSRIILAILDASPGVHILTTSRVRLNLTGEICIAVSSLDTPDPAESLTTQTITQHEAVKLFIDRARAHENQLRLSAPELSQVAVICRRVDGIPLALELVAARTRSQSFDAIVQQLAAPLEVLEDGRRDVPERHRTMASAIQWSYDLLSPKERRFLRRLSVFRGGWDLEAARQVCAKPPIELAEFDDLMSTLVDHSLIVRDDTDAGTSARWRFLEPIRAFARDKLESDADRTTILRQHLGFFRSLAEQAEIALKGADQRHWLYRLEREHANLRAALEFGKQHHPLEALALACGLWRFWYIHAWADEGVQHLLQLIQSIERTPLSLEDDPRYIELLGAAFNAVGNLSFARSEYEMAERYLESARVHRSKLPEREPLMASTFNLALVAQEQDRLVTAQRLLEEALVIAEESGNAWAETNIFRELGRNEWMLCRFEASRQHYERSLDRSRTAEDRHGLARCLHGLAVLDVESGQHYAALARFEQGLTVFEEQEDRRTSALVRADMARTKMEQGLYSVAVDQLESARGTLESLAPGRLEDMVDVTLGIAQLGAGLLSEAQSTLHRSQLRARVSANHRAVALAELGLALLELVREHPFDARAHLVTIPPMLETFATKRPLMQVLFVEVAAALLHSSGKGKAAAHLLAKSKTHRATMSWRASEGIAPILVGFGFRSDSVLEAPTEGGGERPTDAAQDLPGTVEEAARLLESV